MKQRGVVVIYLLAVLAMLAYGAYALYVPPPITLLELLQKEFQHSNIDWKNITWSSLDYPEVYGKHLDLTQPAEVQALYDLLNRYSVIPRRMREEDSIDYAGRLHISGTYRVSISKNFTSHHNFTVYIYPSKTPGYVVVDISGDRGRSPGAYALTDKAS